MRYSGPRQERLFSTLNIVILAAGRGSRTDAAGVPKPLIELFGKPMIEWATKSLGLGLGPNHNYIFVVRKYENDDWNDKLLDTIHCLGCRSTNIISTSEVTEGPACSALLAKQVINNNKPLLIINCDQIMDWDGVKFEEHLTNSDKDGVLVVYMCHKPQNSYVRMNPEDKTLVAEVREKQNISEISTNGIHYWARGKDFVRSATAMISKNIRVNDEFYISETYNELIAEGKKIGIYLVTGPQHNAVGVKDDIDMFKAKYRQMLPDQFQKLMNGNRSRLAN